MHSERIRLIKRIEQLQPPGKNRKNVGDDDNNNNNV